jgi:hypothetical protein
MTVLGGLSLTVWTPQRLSAAQELASIQQLESQAYAQARTGHFDQSDQLLVQAASLSHDPSIEQLSRQSSSFKAQLETFDVERHKQYDELVKQVKLLIDHQKPDYALDIASRAYSLAKDGKDSSKPSWSSREAFRKETWVQKLVGDSIARADHYDQTEQWVKSLRIYSDLSIIEPSVPTWKDKLKVATRRVRLLAMYTPDELKSLQESETAERDAVEQLLHPTTQPATQPSKADPSEKAMNDTFKVDWHETLRGVRTNMLWEALQDADQNYYRGITYKDLALGGLNGIRAVLATKGLEKAFPGLADENSRNQFLAEIAKEVENNQNANPATEQAVLNLTLKHIQRVNRETVNIDDRVITSEFADGAFERLDPFTSMIWPSDLEEFNKATQGRFSGVGVQIQTDDDGSLRVVTPLEDTPAYKAGIKAGDVIAFIDGKNAKHISVNQAVRTITGPPDTTVRLTVRSPDGKIKDTSCGVKRSTSPASRDISIAPAAGGITWSIRRTGSATSASPTFQATLPPS